LGSDFCLLPLSKSLFSVSGSLESWSVVRSKVSFDFFNAPASELFRLDSSFLLIGLKDFDSAFYGVTSRPTCATSFDNSNDLVISSSESILGVSSFFYPSGEGLSNF
jgi:hypothetical protein